MLRVTVQPAPASSAAAMQTAQRIIQNVQVRPYSTIHLVCNCSGAIAHDTRHAPIAVDMNKCCLAVVTPLVLLRQSRASVVLEILRLVMLKLQAIKIQP